MVSTYTPNKKLEQPANNDYVDSWDMPVNADWTAIDKALGSSITINLTGLSGNRVLTYVPPTPPEYQPLKIILSGAPTAATTIRVPSGVGGLWIVRNTTTGGFTISINSVAGGGSVPIPAGTHVLVSCDGTATGMFLAMTAPGPAGGSSTHVQYNSGGTLAGSGNLTFDGTSLITAGFTNTGHTVLGNSTSDTTTVSGPLTLGGTVTFADGTTQTSGGWRRLFRVSPAGGANDVQLRGIPADINDLMLHVDLTPIEDDDSCWMQLIDVGGSTISTPGSYAWSSTWSNSSGIGAGTQNHNQIVNHNTYIKFDAEYTSWQISNAWGIRVQASIIGIRSGRPIGVTWQSSYVTPSGNFAQVAGSGWCWWSANISGLRISTSRNLSARLQAGGSVTLWGSP